MPAPTLSTAALYYNGPGWLYWAPLGTSAPTNTVVGGVFTDAWSAPWVPLGPTDSGSDWSYNQASSPIEVAELLDDVDNVITKRSGSVAFSLANYTAANLAKALNGAALTVTGSAATTLTKITPVAAGSETRCMIGFESTDGTIRKVAYKCLNTGDLKETFNKAPGKTTIPFNFMFGVPSSNVMWEGWTAGPIRA